MRDPLPRSEAGPARLLRLDERPPLDLPGRRARELVGEGSGVALTVRVVELEPERRGTRPRALHRHLDAPEFIWVLAGRGRLVGPDGPEFELAPGEGVLVPPGRPHKMAAQGGALRLLCVFPTAELETTEVEA